VTGDHPWMVRRLVPAVIPLIAILASIGAMSLARLELPRLGYRARGAGAVLAAVLVGLGLALEVAMARDLWGPRHAAGALAGVQELAAALPSNAVVVFPLGQAGIHLALPLGYDFAIDAFAIPSATMTPEIAATLGRFEAAGRAIYWAEEGTGTPSWPAGTTGEVVRTAHVRYTTADGGKTPPPLDLVVIDHVVTLHRVSFR
jgi:hypothetical protein